MQWQPNTTSIMSVATASKPAGDCDNTDVWGASVPRCCAMMVFTASTILSFSQSPPASIDLSASVKCNSATHVLAGDVGETGASAVRSTGELRWCDDAVRLALAGGVVGEARQTYADVSMSATKSDWRRSVILHPKSLSATTVDYGPATVSGWSHYSSLGEDFVAVL